MPDFIIRNEAELRQYIKPYAKQLDKRIQYKLDDITIEYLECTSIFFLYKGDEQEFSILAGSEFHIRDEHTLSLNIKDNIQQHASLYCLIPGINHGLRINGKLLLNKFEINHVYFQCGRAMMRSQLLKNGNHTSRNYTTDHHSKLTNTHRLFLQSNHYALMGTRDYFGNTEISPRGNSSSLLTILNENTLILQEHTGNKVAISIRNLLQVPKISLLLINRKDDQALFIKGTTDIISSDAIKTKPNIQIKIAIQHLEFIDLPVRHQLWDNHNYINENQITPFSKAINIHMNGRGILSKLTQPIVKAIIIHDQKNLY